MASFLVGMEGRQMDGNRERPDEDKVDDESDVLDEVYRKYENSNPFLPITGFIDHSTMGAEALVELGLGDRVRQWVARHRVRPYQAPLTGIPLPSRWTEAIGRRDCHGDWIRHFQEELNGHSAQEVLAEWVPRFAHEVGAFLFHGLIRTAHADRALAKKDTPARRGELARGLALWAIGVRSVPKEGDQTAGAATEPGPDVLDYARFGAAAFVDSPNVPKLHLVTGPMAYLLLARHLDEGTHRIARRSFAQTHHGAAQRFEALKQKVYKRPNGSFDRKHLEPLAQTRDAHPSKLTEAARRAYTLSKDELFLKAAGLALDLHGPRALLAVVKGLLLRKTG